MLRLRSCILTRLLSSPTTPLRRLLLSTTVPVPPIPANPAFAVEDYLLETCGLTPAQALEASTKLSHLKSPSKPDAVLAFLASLGLSTADIAAAAAKDPLLLCAKVDKNLASNVAELTFLGLSHSEIARLVSQAGACLRRRSIVSRLQYYLPLLGSFENLLRALKFNSNLLTRNLERVVKPNVTFLRECGLDACDIAKLCGNVPWLLTSNPERIRPMVACADSLGVPRGSRMFRHALDAVAFLSEEKITAKVEYLKNTLRWSDAEVRIALSRAPSLLRRSKSMLQSRSDFLISEVGLEPAYIAHRPVMLTYSLEGRLRPRYYAVKFLKENGLLDPNRDFNSTVIISEKLFVEKFICPHKEAAPYLAQDYATACRGEVPARFIFA